MPDWYLYCSYMGFRELVTTPCHYVGDTFRPCRDDLWPLCMGSAPFDVYRRRAVGNDRYHNQRFNRIDHDD